MQYRTRRRVFTGRKGRLVILCIPYAKDAVIQFETYHQAGNQVPADGRRRELSKGNSVRYGQFGGVKSRSGQALRVLVTATRILRSLLR